MSGTGRNPNPGKPPALEPSPAAVRVLAHFRKGCNRRLTVPEWGDAEGNPLEIHFDPLTLSERDELRRDANGRDDTVDGTLDYLVRAIILKAKREDGTPIFSPVDRHILRHEAAEHVVRRVAAALLGDDDPEAVEVLEAMQTAEGFPVLVLFDIAAVLGMTVQDLRPRLTEDEFKGWVAWLRLRGRI